MGFSLFERSEIFGCERQRTYKQLIRHGTQRILIAQGICPVQELLWRVIAQMMNGFFIFTRWKQKPPARIDGHQERLTAGIKENSSGLQVSMDNLHAMKGRQRLPHLRNDDQRLLKRQGLWI